MHKQEIKVGDIVTWRRKVEPGSRIQPMGVKGCKVLELGEAEDGEPAAQIDAMGHQMGAYLRDLHKE